MTVLAVFFFSSCNYTPTKASIAMVSDETILPDSVNIFWGDISKGDTVIYTSYKHLPFLKNISNSVIDTLYLAVRVFLISDLSQISKYYIIDSVEKEEDTYTVSLVYENPRVNPYEVIPFPLKYSLSNDQVSLVQYSYYYNNKGSRKGKVGHNQVLLVTYPSEKALDNRRQYYFMDFSRRFFNTKNLGRNVFIYKDTLVEVKRYDMLSGNDMKAQKLTDLQ